MAASPQQLQTALDMFKDWSNYLLVTTVAALGWTSTKDAGLASAKLRTACVAMFALSTVFAIFTLALIPHIAESIRDGDSSIYRVRWDGWCGGKYELMDFCLPQHVLFLFGILLYSSATTFKSFKPSIVAALLLTLFLLTVLTGMLFCIWRART